MGGGGGLYVAAECLLQLTVACLDLYAAAGGQECVARVSLCSEPEGCTGFCMRIPDLV